MPIRQHILGHREAQSDIYGTHSQEGDHGTSDDEDATKPHMYRCELGRLKCLLVDAMMDKT